MSPDTAHRLLWQMRRIRHVELEIARRYPENQMRCPTHLSVGQEGVAAAVGLALRQSDLAVSGHRAHAHYLGKGGGMAAMVAEIYGRSTGCASGKGGSMHLIDEAAGFMGSTAIVGGTIPIGVGLAYGMHCKRSEQVAVIFHGDAAVETGAFFEAANFAATKRLPVLFVCENNQYSVYSHLRVRQPEGRSIADMAAAIGLNTESGDGNDAGAVYTRTSAALERIRAGHGPMLMEWSTYRWLEHCGPNYDNDIGYRTEAEYLEWRAKEPIARYEQTLLDQGIIDAAAIAKMDDDIAAEVSAAFEFALASPFPAPEQAYQDMYEAAQ